MRGKYKKMCVAGMKSIVGKETGDEDREGPDRCEARRTTLNTSSLPSPESMLPTPYTEQPSFLPDILSDIYASALIPYSQFFTKAK